MGRDSLPGNYSMTSVQYQTAISALNRLLDAGNPFVLSVQVGAPVRRQKGRLRAHCTDSLFLILTPSSLPLCCDVARSSPASAIHQRRTVHGPILLQA
jgi:predicted kinase